MAGALRDLDVRLREEFERARSRTIDGGDGLRALYIDEREVKALLEASPQPVGAQIDEGRFDELRETVGLEDFETAILLACLAPEISPSYQRIYGFLQDDIAKTRPTVGLLLRLLGDAVLPMRLREVFHPSSPLALAGLVSMSGSADAPLSDRVAYVDERVVGHLLGSDLVDERLTEYVRLEPQPRPRGLSQSTLVRVGELVATGHRLIALRGKPSIGKTEAARGYAAATGRGLLVVDVAALLASVACSPSQAIRLVFREAVLLDAIVYWSGAETLWDPVHLPVLQSVQALLAVWPIVCFFGGGADWEPPTMLAGRPVRPIALAMPTTEERDAAWIAAMAARGLDDPAGPAIAADLAAGFSLTVRQIVDAVTFASSGGGSDDLATELRAAARAVSGRRLATLGLELTPRATWEQLILPDDAKVQLTELCSTVRYHQVVLDQGFRRRLTGGTGITALFSGVSGTGKTMAAEVIAGELGFALFRIDLAGVVSKWIGETEKNLDRVFQAATDSNAILFFDEADALFGKRSEVKDSHDRYANLEVSYLLQKMEAYDGVAILATNMRHQMDDAFLRRLTFNVIFPMPEEADRVRIWAAAWPAELARAADVDLAALARIKLVGGNIKNVILAAAHHAAAVGRPVAMADLILGVRREYQKLGKQLSADEILAGLAAD